MRSDDDRITAAEAGKFLGLTVGGWVAIVVAVVVTSTGLWALRVATSPVKGAGDVRIQRDSARNRIAAQAYFEDTYAKVKAFDQQIGDAQTDLDAFKANNQPPDGASPVKTELYAQQINARQTTLAGLVQQCHNTVAAYNAEARKTLAADWRAEDLPREITAGDPATDCKGAAA